MKEKETAVVRTPYGTLEGFVSENGVKTFLGVPYAKPPIGEYRWKAPRKPDPSKETIPAKEFGLSAMQHYDQWELASVRPKGEDCLTLNIWYRETERKNKPVMVYIHGGGFYSGGSSDPLYWGENIVHNFDVIVVSINYRINFYGFLNLAEIDPEYKESGYCGTLDQITALEWVNENIGLFGGDNKNVTIFGESCGSASVMHLSVIPRANRLFQKAIAESGPIQLYNTPENSERYARDFMAMCGCATVGEMLAMSVEELAEVYDRFREKYYYEIELLFAPTADGNLLPKQPFKALKDGAAAGIRLLNGTTRDEYNYWALYYDDLATEMPLFHGYMMPIHYDGKLDGEKYIRRYEEKHPGEDPGRRYLEFMTQMDFRVPHELMSRYQSAYNDVYMYLFTYESKIDRLGSCHAIELPFVTGNLDSESGLNFTGENPPKALSEQMMAAWVNFAEKGDPNGGKVPTKWVKYTYDQPQTMVIGEKGWHMEKNCNRENVELLEGAVEETII